MTLRARTAAALACSAILLAAASPVAATAGVPAAPSPQFLAGVNVPGLGVGATPQEADRTIAYAARLHVAAVRTDVPWAVMEPRAQGEVDPQALAFTDRLVKDAAAANIRLVVTVAGTPCWTSSAPRRLRGTCSPQHESAANGWPPTSAAAYAEFVSFLAARYRSQLAAIEIWNEPDQANELYFAGPHKAARYAALLRAAYPAIKRAAPEVPVLAGSLVGSNGVFLRDLYAAGIKGFYDGLSVHYYNLTLASLRSIHEAQLAAGDHTQLWLDEFGWTSCWPRERTQQDQACVTAGVQAANLLDTVRALAKTPYVAAALIYKLQDSGREDFGLLSATGSPKLAFQVLARVLPAAAGAPAPVTLRLRRRGSHLLASGSAPVGDFMFLEVFRGALARYRAIFTLDRFDRYSITLPAVLGTSGLRVRVFGWTAPERAAQRSA